MIFKTTMWILCLTFVATIYNVVSAYNAMGAMNVQDKFERIGLLDDEVSGKYPLPARKPTDLIELAYDEE